MSHYATPFIVINLGCEMLYVIEQRLKAQGITQDKSEKVLSDITNVLLHPKLLEDLFIPQPVATHTVIKRLLVDISSTSIMKLDDYSMNKLWDLMTMIYKWQLSVATNQNIFDITRRHLKCVATLLPSDFPKSIIEYAMKMFQSLEERFSDSDYNGLRNTMILWFSEYHTKISVLLRLGLQRKDGTFNMPATIKPIILKNLGENIYKYDTKKNPDELYENQCTDNQEINCLLAAIETEKPEHKIMKSLFPLKFGESEISSELLSKYKELQISFEHIATDVKNDTTNELRFIPQIPKSPQEDLLQMMQE